MMGLVVLPQALTLVIPGIVNNFIGLFKDTTLVAIVGMIDFLAAMDNAFKDTIVERADDPRRPATSSPALFYFVFCFAMSRYSACHRSARLAQGRRRR